MDEWCAVVGVSRERAHKIRGILRHLLFRREMLLLSLCSVLLIMTEAALAAVSLTSRPQLVALPTHELRLNRREQTTAHTKHTAGERVDPSACNAAGHSGANALLTLPAW